MNRPISPFRNTSPTRLAPPTRSQITPVTMKPNTSQQSPMMSSNASQYMPHVPLKTEPQQGMKTVLRPIAYEAVHVPISENQYNVPPTSTGPAPTVVKLSHAHNQSPSRSNNYGSTSPFRAHAPISGYTPNHYTAPSPNTSTAYPSFKPTSVSTYLTPKYNVGTPTYASATNPKDNKPLNVRNPSEVVNIRVENHDPQVTNDGHSHRSEEPTAQNQYYMSRKTPSNNNSM